MKILENVCGVKYKMENTEKLKKIAHYQHLHLCTSELCCCFTLQNVRNICFMFAYISPVCPLPQHLRLHRNIPQTSFEKIQTNFVLFFAEYFDTGGTSIQLAYWCEY